MANVKTRIVTTGLIRKGFREEHTDHLKFFYMTHGPNPRKTEVWTYISHQSKGVDIPSWLIGRMAQQCRLSSSEFIDLVRCSDHECGSYDKILVKKGVVGPKNEFTGLPSCREAIRRCHVEKDSKTP